MTDIEWTYINERQVGFRSGIYQANIWRGSDSYWFCVLECGDKTARRGGKFISLKYAQNWCVQQMLADQLGEAVRSIKSVFSGMTDLH